MKLKQRVVVLCAVLLLLGLAKIFLLDGGEGSAASRRDLRAFRKVSERSFHQFAVLLELLPMTDYCLILLKKH